MEFLLKGLRQVINGAATNGTQSALDEEIEMSHANTNPQINNGNSEILTAKNTMRLLGGVLIAGFLAMATTFGTASAEAGPVKHAAASYTVSPPVLSGPPTTVDGVTSIAGTVDVITLGTHTGTAAVDFSCTLGTGIRGANECEGSFLFEGIVAGKTGTFKADMLDWTGGGEDAFTVAGFRMVPGSGTGELTSLITIGGDLRRDEAAGEVGAFIGDLQFEIVEEETSASTLTEFTVSELFVMEAEGTITTEELIEELTIRNG